MIVPTIVLLAEVVGLIAGLVSRVVGRSVPADARQAAALAGRLYPNVVRLRQVAARRQWAEVDRHMRSEYRVVVDPAPLRPYPRDAVVKAVEFAAGLDEGGKAARPKDLGEFRDRLSQSLGQHVQNAARELVIDSANLNSVHEFDPRQADWDEEEARRNREDDPDGEAEVVPFPVQERDESDREAKEVLEEASKERHEENVEQEAKRPKGPVLGWARVLVGEVNCPFCAMLASRGAVYKSEKTAGFQAHSRGPQGGGDCDCVATMVVKGQSWEGDKEAAFLQDLWEDARDNPNEYEREMMERGLLMSPAARFRSRFAKLVREGGVERFHSEAARLGEERVAEMRRPYRVS